MIWIAALLALLALNAWATRMVLQDELSSSIQRAVQLAIVWLFPVVGAVLTIAIKKQSAPRGTGRYRDKPEPPDDFGYSGRGPRHARDRHEEEVPPAHPDGD